MYPNRFTCCFAPFSPVVLHRLFLSDLWFRSVYLYLYTQTQNQKPKPNHTIPSIPSYPQIPPKKAYKTSSSFHFLCPPFQSSSATTMENHKNKCRTSTDPSWVILIPLAFLISEKNTNGTLFFSHHRNLFFFSPPLTISSRHPFLLKTGFVLLLTPSSHHLLSRHHFLIGIGSGFLIKSSYHPLFLTTFLLIIIASLYK